MQFAPLTPHLILSASFLKGASLRAAPLLPRLLRYIIYFVNPLVVSLTITTPASSRIVDSSLLLKCRLPPTTSFISLVVRPSAAANSASSPRVADDRVLSQCLLPHSKSPLLDAVVAAPPVGGVNVVEGGPGLFFTFA